MLFRQAEAPRLRRNPHDPQNSSINHTLSRQSRATLIEYPNRSPQTWTHLGEVLILEKKHTSTAQPAVDLIDEKNVRARTALAEARHAAYTLLFYDVLGEVRTEENELPLPDQFGAWMELMEVLLETLRGRSSGKKLSSSLVYGYLHLDLPVRSF